MRLFKKKRPSPPGEASEAPAGRVQSDISSSLEENIATLQRLFEDMDLLQIRRIQSSQDKHFRCCIAYCDGVVSAEIINQSVVKPLMLIKPLPLGEDPVGTVIRQVVQIGDVRSTDQIGEIVEGVCYGDTVLFIEGQNQAVLLNTKQFPTRAIDEPENEKTLLGPRDGFNESLMDNLSLIRRRALTPDLKIKRMNLGQRTKTKICVCYLDRLVNKQVLTELYRRLESIDIDGILDQNYITELIRDSPWSLFRTTGYTERPDVVMGKLLEGRVAVFVDGSPMVMTVPYLFVENFQSSEDYCMNFFYASSSRLLRIAGFFLTLVVPGFYVSVAAFHHEMFPLHLFINVASERQSVPLPAAVEAFIMMVVFEILKETGARMPSTIGQTLSIVGALVIGQSAVEAELVAAPMIIVVALTGITGLLIPKLNAPIIYLRIFLLLLSSMFGFFGLLLGCTAILIHLLNLSSFGVPAIMSSKQLRYQNVKDTVIRAPWWQMIQRPVFAKDRTRQSKTGGGHHG